MKVLQPLPHGIGPCYSLETNSRIHSWTMYGFHTKLRNNAKLLSLGIYIYMYIKQVQGLSEELEAPILISPLWGVLCPLPTSSKQSLAAIE